MYENPFWFIFYKTGLSGHPVPLQPQHLLLGIESTQRIECYPAKLAHGHVTWLIKQGVPFIFYPALFYERNGRMPTTTTTARSLHPIRKISRTMWRKLAAGK
ncbi:MAG: acyl-CoA dehydratase activase-related protein [Gallintestinimicrobium sp.]